VIEELVVIALGCFLASIVNAALATGGIYIMLAATTAVLPVSVAIPMQTVLALPSLIGRIYMCRRDINWPIAKMFLPMAVPGSLIGAGVFVALDEGIIAIALGLILLALIWLVPKGISFGNPRRFLLVGGLHGFFGTVFGVGLFLQPAILRTEMTRMQITGTLAVCLLGLDIVKSASYVSFGFNYLDYLPHIGVAFVASLQHSFGRTYRHLDPRGAFSKLVQMADYAGGYAFVTEGGQYPGRRLISPSGGN